MDTELKNSFQGVIFALMYMLLFLILMPSLIRLMDERLGKILYGVLVVGAIIVAVRLRFLSRRLQ